MLLGLTSGEEARLSLDPNPIGHNVVYLGWSNSLAWIWLLFPGHSKKG